MMKKTSKRILSIALAIILVISSVSCAFLSFAAPYQNGDSLPHYDDENKIYTRLSYDIPLQFTTDYDCVVDCFREHLKNRDTQFSIKFATTDERYAYNPTDENSIRKIPNMLINRVLYDTFTSNIDDPFSGDFLYHSINMSGDGFTPTYQTYDTSRDFINGQQYYCFEIGLTNIDYYTDNREEKYFEKFVEKFNEEYIPADATDYEKVKIIYDFVVRNVTYDYEVYRSKDTNEISKDDPRFNGAHSGYGAVCGNVKLKDGQKHFAGQYEDGTLDFDKHFDELYAPINTVEGQNIENHSNWGLAVCEGFSKLFYVLCISNNVPCRIVDGNYAEGVLDKDGKQLSDAHEWNCVYLDDGIDGPQWYEVDTTYASQESIKSIDYNSYDFFLVGTENDVMSEKRHPIPYEIEYNDYGDVVIYHFDKKNDHQNQLYNWYTGQYSLSKDDYRFPEYNFVDIDSVEVSDRLKSGVLISRTYEYEGEPRTAFILSEKGEDGKYSFIRVEINEDGNVVHSEKNEKGFPYRSADDLTFTYHFMIPYVVNSGTQHDIVVNSNETRRLVDVGNYNVSIKGADKSITISVPITALDMSGDGESVSGNYSSANIERHASYTGSVITPYAEVFDGFDTKLVEGRDYDIKIYSDPLFQHPTQIKEMGNYYVRIEYKGNYYGHYKFNFDVGKIDLSLLNDNTYNFTYVPKKMRKQDSFEINNIANYYTAGASKMTIGELSLLPNKDYTVSYSTTSNDASGLSFGSKGTITLTATDSSDYVKKNTKKVYNYEVKDKYDINNSALALAGKYACSSAFVYTGSAIKPSVLDNVNRVFDSDEYDIVDDSYTNCVNAGDAKVTIVGKNGCTGKVTMKYAIQKKALDNDIVDVVASGTNLYIDLNYNGMALAPNEDYVVKRESNKITISAASNGNYIGDYVINIANANMYSIVYSKAPSHIHKTVGTVTRATATKNGKITYKCSSCGQSFGSSVIHYPKTVSLSATAYTYDGKAKNPSVTVKGADGKVIPASNYTVTYPSGRKNVGKYTVKITFSGYYSGTVSKSFVINPKNTSSISLTALKKGFKASWKKYTTQTTGYQIQYSTSSKFTSPKTVTVSKNTASSTTVSKLNAKKKYYVRIRTYNTVSGTKYYSSWSSTKSIVTK